MPKVRWNCLESGCFNLKLRPKIEVFDECFPGRIAFGDVDALVEMGGLFLLLEWKSDGGTFHVAQRIASEHFTRILSGNVVLLIEGNAKTMQVSRYCYFWQGRQSDWKFGALQDVKIFIERWVAFAEKKRSLRLVKSTENDSELMRSNVVLLP